MRSKFNPGILRSIVRAFPVVATVAALVAGCGSSGTGATKAGGDPAPITLRVATDDSPGKPAAEMITEFAKRVDALSDGRIHVEGAWHAAGDGPEWDQRNARLVTSGEVEMGMIPSRAWDTEGVRTLRPLNAPFLVDSESLVAKVVTGDVANDLLAGLDEAGVVGLALMPEDLRHPFGFDAPLRGSEDYAGQVIRAGTSETIADVFDQLGASTTEDDPNAATQAGMESGFQQTVRGTPTANVTFYPKVNALVINAKAYAGLSEAQRSVLEEAADQTRDWVLETKPTEAEGMAKFCQTGSAVLATEQELAQLHETTQPVYAELERDAATRDLIGRIRGLKEQTAAESPARACAGSPKAPKGSGKTLDITGVYRYEVTDAHLRQAGVTDPGQVAENHGLITDTITKDKYCWVQRAPNAVANGEACEVYEMDGNRLTITYAAGAPDVYTVKKLPNGDLKWTYVSAQAGDEGVVKAYAIPVHKRIGDAP